ncbi:MAG: class I tRNA ligase family protein, partial [Patescibacteria group bacterium]
MNFRPVDPKMPLAEIEHKQIEYWKRKDIFKKSLAMREGKPKFIFFDGPPFANGQAHYGHILANAIKDAVTRYFSMKGYYVPRVNGWDCHGL